MKKRILFLCQYFYPEKVSSATLPFETARAFIEAGYSVGVMCGYPLEYLQNSQSKIALDEIVDEIEIHRIKYRSFSKKTFIGRIRNYFSFTLKCLLQKKRIKDFDCVIVYSNPPILPHVAYIAKKKYGTKIVFVSYDVYPELAINTNSISKKGFVSKLMNGINKKVFRVVDRVVTLSDEMKHYLSLNRNVAIDKIITIPNWYHKCDNPIKPKGMPFTISYLGNIGTCQDIDTLLNAIKNNNDNINLKFLLAGRGNKLEHVKLFLEQNNLSNVVLRDYLIGDEYNKAMSDSDCFVVSLESKTTGLCFPSKYYSYLAYAKPIIAIMPQNELTNEIENNGIGFCVRNGDYVSFNKYVESLLSMSNDLYTKICNRAKNVFLKKYTQKECTQKYVAMIESLFAEDIHS